MTYKIATVTVETGERHVRTIDVDDSRDALISPDIPVGERVIYVLEKVES
jgi:hypothetical protein